MLAICLQKMLTRTLKIPALISPATDAEAMNMVVSGSFPPDGKNEHRNKICGWYLSFRLFPLGSILSLENFMKNNRGFCNGYRPTTGGGSGGDSAGFSSSSTSDSNEPKLEALAAHPVTLIKGSFTYSNFPIE